MINIFPNAILKYYLEILTSGIDYLGLSESLTKIDKISCFSCVFFSVDKLVFHFNF